MQVEGFSLAAYAPVVGPGVTVWDSSRIRDARRRAVPGSGTGSSTRQPHLGSPMPYGGLRGGVDAFFDVIDVMGQRSQAAQGLGQPLTSIQKLQDVPNQRLYVISEPIAAVSSSATTSSSLGHMGGSVGAGGLMGSSRGGGSSGDTVIGILKVGPKKLFIRTRTSALVEMEPLCVLDFYVHERYQRHGCGRVLFDAMLQAEGRHPALFAYDRPSPKLIGFLRKHFGLSEHVPQTNNFVLFDRYFETPKDMPPPPPIYESSGGGIGSGRRSGSGGGRSGSGGGSLPPLGPRGLSPPTAQVPFAAPPAAAGAGAFRLGSAGAAAARVTPISASLSAAAAGALDGPQPRSGPPPLPTPIGGGASGRGTPVDLMYPTRGGGGASIAGRSAMVAGLSSGGGPSTGVSAALGASCGSDGLAGYAAAAPMRRAVSPTRSGAGYDIIAPALAAIVPSGGGARRGNGSFVAGLPQPITAAVGGGALNSSLSGSMTRPLYGRRA